MSRRNTRQDKARRRAERERRRGSSTSGQGPAAVEVQTVQVAPRSDGSGHPNSGEHGTELRSDADDGLGAVEAGEADLDTDADPGDFGDLDADDADLQATLTVLAVLADDIGDAAEAVDDLDGDAEDLAGDAEDPVGDAEVLVGDAEDLQVPDAPEDLRDPETGPPSAAAGGG